jgi:protein-arginine kinase activator protein McsA
MKTSRWEWPVNWDVKRQKQFLDDSLKYAEQKEFYEQCAIIRDVQQKIK